MKPKTLSAIETARDAACFLRQSDASPGIARQIELHLSCIRSCLSRRLLIETGQKLLDLGKETLAGYHFISQEVIDGAPLLLHFSQIPSASALAPVLRVAAQAGYRKQAPPEIDKDSLTVTWHLQDATGVERFTICATLDSEKVACKQVQIGTREVPVFEMQCDQATEAEFAKLSEEAQP